MKLAMLMTSSVIRRLHERVREDGLPVGLLVRGLQEVQGLVAGEPGGQSSGGPEES